MANLIHITMLLSVLCSAFDLAVYLIDYFMPIYQIGIGNGNALLMFVNPFYQVFQILVNCTQSLFIFVVIKAIFEAQMGKIQKGKVDKDDRNEVLDSFLGSSVANQDFWLVIENETEQHTTI